MSAYDEQEAMDDDDDYAFRQLLSETLFPAHEDDSALLALGAGSTHVTSAPT